MLLKDFTDKKSIELIRLNKLYSDITERIGY